MTVFLILVTLQGAVIERRVMESMRECVMVARSVNVLGEARAHCVVGREVPGWYQGDPVPLEWPG
jgi:hypothetical protein